MFVDSLQGKVHVVRRPLLIALTFAALSLGSCSNASDPTPPGPDASGSTAGSATPTASETRTPSPTTDQTWSSIGQLDACKLSAAGRGVEFDGRLTEGATTCTTWTSAQNSNVTVRIGVRWKPADLRGLTRTPIAGFEAWVGTTGDDCLLLLPAGGTAATFSSEDQPDCAPLVAQAATVLGRLRSDPHAYDLARPRPVACQVLASAGLAATGDLATACTSGEVTAWLVAPATYEDDTPVSLGNRRATRSRRLPQQQSITLKDCSVRWSLARDIEAVVLAPTCEQAIDVARKATAPRWQAPEPGPLAFDGA